LGYIFSSLLGLNCLLSCSSFHFLLEATLPSIDSSVGGSAARHYEVGTLREAPIPAGEIKSYAGAGINLWKLSCFRYRFDEASGYFCPTDISQGKTVREIAESVLRQIEDAAIAAVTLHYEADKRAARDYHLTKKSLEAMHDYLGPHPGELPLEGWVPTLTIEEAYCLTEDQLADRLVQQFGGKRRFSKQTWILDKRLELTA
jgi:hypothetical protein